MFVLGLAGGLDLVHEQRLDSPENYTYDGAAVLLENGEVVAAIEEERFDRIKHSNKFPVKAIEFCLDTLGLRPTDVARYAYYVDEASADALLTRIYLENPEFPRRMGARELFCGTLSAALHCNIEPSKLQFFEHKLTHAACAMHQSGFEESLVYVIDNAGGLYWGRRHPDSTVSLETLAETTPAKSIQKLCHTILPFLGLGLFEEHKAQALADYGDPEEFLPLLGRLYELEADGMYTFRLGRAITIMETIQPPRGGAGLSSRHHDLAAALQHVMEDVTLHVLRHFRAKTGLRHLCIAGGMAENTATNSRFLYAELFDDVFVHPVAYDSGCALGAALLASQGAGHPAPRARVQAVAWGSNADNGGAGVVLDRWSGFLDGQLATDAARDVAELIRRGSLVGWVQGRSHFGCRALGNRNALADPRVARNRAGMHEALGRAETYRPLALLIRQEDLGEWCNLPGGVVALPFQTFAVRVRPERRLDAAAALQTDGRARVQTVVREDSPRLWRLLEAMGDLTGVAALLSTSLNRGTEPTAETVEDAVACFLGSGLDRLVFGDVVMTKKAPRWEAWMALCLTLPAHVRLIRARGWLERQSGERQDTLSTTHTPGVHRVIGRSLANLLEDLDGGRLVGDLLASVRTDPEGAQRLLDEITSLWSAGLVGLCPDPNGGTVS